MPASPRSGTRLPGGDICTAQEPPPHGGTSARSGRKYKCRIPPRAGASARSAMERRTHGHGTTPEHTGEEGATPPAHIPAFPPRRDFPETRCARGKGLFPPPGIQQGRPFRGAPSMRSGISVATTARLISCAERGHQRRATRMRSMALVRASSARCTSVSGFGSARRASARALACSALSTSMSEASSAASARMVTLLSAI